MCVCVGKLNRVSYCLFIALEDQGDRNEACCGASFNGPLLVKIRLYEYVLEDMSELGPTQGLSLTRERR